MLSEEIIKGNGQRTSNFTLSQAASYIYGGEGKIKGQVVSTRNSIIRKKLRVRKYLSNQVSSTT